jgi:hypothetical protein
MFVFAALPGSARGENGIGADFFSMSLGIAIGMGVSRY